MPNAGGVLILGLGCESNQINKLLAEIPDLDRTRLRAFAAQALAVGAERIDFAQMQFAELAEQARALSRTLEAHGFRVAVFTDLAAFRAATVDAAAVRARYGIALDARPARPGFPAGHFPDRKP